MNDQMDIVDYCVAVFADATRRVEQAQAAETKAARDRVAALRALYDRVGMSCPEIAKLVGLSGARVHQLISKAVE